ncbi:craniofacial development protein 2-like [Hetaerina americana]|uniref:craniofacial development protein 2-like n=1 Tax=Hetaerina americana TaxID=62018 RepID=UPI003A7F2E1B
MKRLYGEPTDTEIVQVYMPTSSHSEEEKEEVYEQLKEVTGAAKGEENIIVIGYWNAVVGESREGRSVGQFGLGKRTPAGESLIEFCNEKNMVGANTLFEQHRRRRYTRKMPGDRTRYQIEYIHVRTRYRNKVKQCKSYPGADINCDHKLFVMDSQLRYKKIKELTQEPRWNTQMLEENRQEKSSPRPLPEN